MINESIRVIIADDHAMVRSGLRLFLLAFEDLRMVGEAANGEEAVRLCAKEKPDVILMDLVMPMMDGIRATQELHVHFPNIKVIGLTSFFDPELIEEMLNAGAISFLMKNIQATELASAIRDAYHGKPTISTEILDAIKRKTGLFHPAQKSSHNLSAREMEVLALVAIGLSNAAIAQKLVISLSTAKFHVSSILTKLNVSNRSEAVSLALQEGLIDTSMHLRKSGKKPGA